MENNIDAGSFLYSDIFKKVSAKHIVPTLQRPYVWADKKQVRKFLEDIIENKDYYFIGSLVFVSSRNGTVGREEIIDGQQRMITIALILVAVRDIVKEQRKEEELDTVLREINSFLRYTDSYDDKKIIRLKFSDQRTDSFYRRLLEGSSINVVTETQKRIKDNYFYISTRLKELFSKDFVNSINKFLLKIRTLRIIAITCDSNVVAYKLFASINATGMSLASVDLIKNFLFGHSEKNKGSLSVAEKYWQQLEEVFIDNRSLFKTFLRHQWISNGQYVNHIDLYSAVEEKYNKKELVPSEYIKVLLNDAKVYLSLRNAEIESLKEVCKGKRFDVKNIKVVLEFLSFLNVDQVYSPILFFYKTAKKEDFKKYLNKLVAFQFLYKYVPGSPSSAEKIFADFARKEKDINNNFQNLLKLVDNSEGIFKSNFSKKASYKGSKNGDIQFILEQQVFSKSGPKSFKEPTIEHIISQGKNREGYYQKIGNLTIFERDINSKMPEEFKDKIKYYKGSQYSEHHNILSEYDFYKNPEDAISVRTEDVAAEVYNIFINMLKVGKIQ